VAVAAAAAEVAAVVDVAAVVAVVANEPKADKSKEHET
jgi:hypothetical protein